MCYYVDHCTGFYSVRCPILGTGKHAILVRLMSTQLFSYQQYRSIDVQVLNITVFVTEKPEPNSSPKSGIYQVVSQPLKLATNILKGDLLETFEN